MNMLAVWVVVQKYRVLVQFTKTHALHVVSSNLAPIFFADFFAPGQPKRLVPDWPFHIGPDPVNHAKFTAEVG